MNGTREAKRLVDSAVAKGLVEARDRTWAFNTVLAHLNEVEAGPEGWLDEDFRANLMGLVMPRPSQVAERFWALHRDSPKAATDYFYRLSCDAGYVRTEAVTRNLVWDASTEWGPLRITINCSKPEKDPRDIARLARAQVQDSEAEPYPACRLCMENEGFWGRPAGDPRGAYPPRGNLRIVPLQLAGCRWGLQYSPYAYYNEHCIAMNSVHVPMHIDRQCFEAMFDFIDQLPHYFIGSNADLPIVGGSILNHDHFQGGRFRFPMDEAPCAEEFEVPGFPTVRARVLKWPVSVLSLRARDRGAIIGAACRVLKAWRGYDDQQVGIVSRTGGVRHNTITPILRIDGEEYVLNLALRCNITSADHPLGVFHPHEELHHIKKENIGLIEVMGLAILPGRLKCELATVADVLAGQADAAHGVPAAAHSPQSPDAGGASSQGSLFSMLTSNPLTVSHASWACDVAARHDGVNRECAEAVLRQEVGQVFARVLETAGVFKWDDAGRAALRRFLRAI